MCEIFYDIGNVLKWSRNRRRIDLPENLIMHDVVMAWPCSPLKCGMCLQEKIPVLCLGHPAVDDSTRLGITRPIAVFLGGGVESGFMLLAADYNSKL